MTLEAFLERYNGELSHIAKGLARGDKDMADELLQRARIKCFERWDSLSGDGINRWVARVMVYEALMIRRASRRNPVAEYAGDDGVVRSPEGALHARQLISIAIPDDLSERDALLLMGFTRKEAADKTGTSPFTQIRQSQATLSEIRNRIMEHDEFCMEVI